MLTRLVLTSALFTALVVAPSLAETAKPKPRPVQPPPEFANCLAKPDRGPCKALMERYYFDSERGVCRPFVWGGCQGTVPFETLEACNKACVMPKN
jgi:hypothetical protein